LLLVILLLVREVAAQHMPTGREMVDSNSLLQAFKRGTVTGHFRHFLMTTDNAAGLSDYYAAAIGGGIHYQTQAFHHLRLGLSGYFIYNLFSSDLGRPDPQTGAYNRYEIGLFDITDPYNKHHIDRLEELYLNYQRDGNTITFGKQLIQTPFINPQDSRMRPTAAEGLYVSRQMQHVRMEAAWIYRIAPRGTVEWYRTGNSIGLYPQGVNVHGAAGNYQHHLRSAGIGLAGLHWQPDSSVHVQAWEQYADRLFNTVLIQAQKRWSVNAGVQWLLAVQYIRQDRLRDGGNADPQLTYFPDQKPVHVMGIRAGWQYRQLQWMVNYTRITAGGRFTMPREWGTEPLFTYLSRERNEGYGDVNAINTVLKADFKQAHLKTEIGYGHYYMPDVQNYALSKYGVPSYRHLKIYTDYSFQHLWKGLDVGLLFIYKGSLHRTDLRTAINKVNMTSYNLIMNFRF